MVSPGRDSVVPDQVDPQPASIIDLHHLKPKQHRGRTLQKIGIQVLGRRQPRFRTQQLGKRNHTPLPRGLDPEQGEEHGTRCGAQLIGIGLGNVVLKHVAGFQIGLR